MTPDLSSSAFKMLVAGQYFAAVDLETTNCGPDSDGRDVYRIIAVGVAVGINGRRVDKKHWLVNPGSGVIVDPKSSSYNKITTTDLSKAKPTVKVLAEVTKLLGKYRDVIVLAHNAPFDIGLLNEEYDRTTLDRPGVDVIDTISAAKVFDPSSKRRRSLVALCEYFAVSNAVRGTNARVRKAEKDALDTLDLWWRLAALASASGVEDMPQALLKTSSAAFEAIEFVVPRFVTRETPPPIPTTHHQQAHGYRLGSDPTEADWVQFKHEIEDCMRLRCYAASAKLTAEHDKYLTAVRTVSELLKSVKASGETGTLLGAVTPMFDYLSIREAQRWMKDFGKYVPDLPRCQPGSSCPACIAGAPCPQDVVYRQLAPRLVAYGDGHTLYGDRADDDLLNVATYTVKMNTWSWVPWGFFLAPVMVLVLRELASVGLLIRYRETLAACVDRQLHLMDAELGLMVAKYWAGQGKFDMAAEVADSYSSLTTTDPAAVQLGLWSVDTLPALKARFHRPPKSDQVLTSNPLRRRPKPANGRHPYQLF